MTAVAPGTVTELYRYPIKGISREALDTVEALPDAPIPGDRAWAMLHTGAPDIDEWQPRRNFLVVANGPKLAQITAKTDPSGDITLSHPDAEPLHFDPAVDGEALKAWVAPFWPERQRPAHRLVKAPPQSMADIGEAQVSILNLASLRALSDAAGTPLEIERFRGNIIVDGLGPWEEFEWVGRSIAIGPVTLDVTERIERCQATEASPMTGERNAKPVAILQSTWGHRDFGIYARVRTAGAIAKGDPISLV